MYNNLVKKELEEYITTNIFKIYDLNGKSHDINHIKYVLQRAFEISKTYKKEVDYNMLFTAVSYHDIGDHINREEHEKISAKMMMEDEKLNAFFNIEQKNVIKDAIEDCRSSNKNVPRNIYGKILASADKNIDIDSYFKRSLEYGLEHYADISFDAQLDRAYEHAVNKFGKNGYAVSKYYVQDDKYSKYLNDLQNLIENKEEFYKIAKTTLNQIIN